MQYVVVERAVVNIEALDANLRAALGTLTSGVSVGLGQVVVHLLDTATSVEVNKARALVLAHDPALLTPEQQARLIRQAKLEQARQDYGTVELDLAVFAAQPDPVRQLAQKIAWLEQEINQARKG